MADSASTVLPLGAPFIAMLPMGSIAPTYTDAAKPRWVLPTVVLVHVALVVGMLWLDVLPIPATLPPMMVQLIPTKPSVNNAPPARPVAKPRKTQPVAVSQTAVTEVPVVAVQFSSPSISPQQATSTPPSPSALPVVISLPRFDADYLNNPAPPYPPLSRRAGEQGTVLLRVFVASSGQPTQVDIKTSSGSPRLDQAAQEAVWRWKFVPARRGDEAVGAWVNVPVVFSLRG